MRRSFPRATALMLILGLAGYVDAADCIKRTLRDDAYAFKLRVRSTTGYFKVNVGTGPTHGECPAYRVNFTGRKTILGNPAAWKSVREEACFVIGETGPSELIMEWDVVIPFVPDSGISFRFFPSGSAGTLDVSLRDFSGAESVSWSITRNVATQHVPKAKLPPPGGLRSVLAPKPVLAPQMGAYLFPWYGLPGGPAKALRHWDAGNFLFTPLGGRYDSGDPAHIAKQMAWAKQAGFNLLVLSYWDAEFSNKNTAPILTGAAAAGIGISAMLETVSRRPGVSPRDCFLAQIREVQRDYAAHPAWLKAQGKPILFVYDRIVDELKAASGADWWADWLWVKAQIGDGLILMAPITDAITPERIKATGGGSVFAANSGAGNPWVGADADDWGWTWKATLGGGLSALPILPRFERAAEPGDIPNYRNQWRAARAGMPDIILVNSWNEYHESSVIEPTDEFGTDWLRLSAREAATFCSGELGPLVDKSDVSLPDPMGLAEEKASGEGPFQEAGAAWRSGSRRVAYGLPGSSWGGGMVFRIDGARPAGLIALYGIDGSLIRELSVRNGRAEWDGRDSRGRSVAPGVYWLRPSARP